MTANTASAKSAAKIRNDNPDFEEWVESDLKYIRERGMWTDFKIFLMTIWVVLTGKGAM